MRRLLYIMLLLLVACRYADFAPITPSPVEAWVVNAQIAELSEMSDPVFGNLVVEGVVVANDSTGNFYKQIIIVDRDQTSSLAISIGYYDSFSQFPEGQLVAIQLEGLVLKKVDGLLTAGYQPLASDTIPAPISTLALTARHLHLQGAKVVLPTVCRRFDELTLKDVGLPFVFTDVYFENPIGVYAGEHTLRRLSADTTATLYTSPYTTFASQPVPSSVFDVMAIVTAYKNKIQLKITSPDCLNKNLEFQ